MKNRDLTVGSITGGLWVFAMPLMLGNIMQQLYNLADTWIVGNISVITLIITAVFYIFLDPIISLLQIPAELTANTKTYLI